MCKIGRFYAFIKTEIMWNFKWVVRITWAWNTTCTKSNLHHRAILKKKNSKQLFLKYGFTELNLCFIFTYKEKYFVYWKLVVKEYSV